MGIDEFADTGAFLDQLERLKSGAKRRTFILFVDRHGCGANICDQLAPLIAPGATAGQNDLSRLDAQAGEFVNTRFEGKCGTLDRRTEQVPRVSIVAAEPDNAAL